ncbi:MAG TPA: hypothetical protein VLA29_02830 [Acidimicrobiia bacterium]|nr:hypothetical protein [Acidimicrobiia bacterium]
MKRHAFDPISFVFGIILMAMAAGAVWNDQIDWNIGVWILPTAVLVLGIGLLTSTIRNTTRSDA